MMDVETAVEAIRARHEAQKESLREKLSKSEGRQIEDWELDLIGEATVLGFRQWVTNDPEIAAKIAEMLMASKPSSTS